MAYDELNDILRFCASLHIASRILHNTYEGTVIDLRHSKSYGKKKQEGHDGPEIAHLSLLTKHAPSSFPVT